MDAVVERVPLIDEILDAERSLRGADLAAYRGHVLRVFNFCRALGADDAASEDKAAIASAFHDIGVWPDGSLDYLEPSAQKMCAWAAGRGISETAEIRLMIVMHHKLTAYVDEHAALVEVFRRADLVDASLGLVRFGLSREFIRDVRQRFPDQGFHLQVLQVIGRWMVRHPTRPLPILRW